MCRQQQRGGNLGVGDQVSKHGRMFWGFAFGPASAIRGPIIPLPLQTPDTVTFSRPILTLTAAALRVKSVVRIESAKSSACSELSPRYWAASRIPESTCSIGIKWRIIPVELGRISVALGAEDFRRHRAHLPGVLVSLASGAGVGVTRIDHDPAENAAGNVLSADLDRRCQTLLVVNTAAAEAAVWHTSRPTSGLCLDLIPA